MIPRPPRSTLPSSSAASDVYKRQAEGIAGGLDPPYQLCRGWVKVAHVPHCSATNPTCRRRRPQSLCLAVVGELQGDVEVGFAKHGDHRLQVVLLLGAHPQLVSLDLGLHALGPLSPDHLGDLLGVLIRDALVDRHLDPELLAGLAWVGRLDSLE